MLTCANGGGQLDPAPIWPNLKTFPWGAFSDRVDILSGGYPCQPFSAAGKRLGTDDPRHLWPFIADGIRIMRPKLCFFENVEGHISLGLRAVIEELGSLGYKTTWGIFSAREVGAPHQRKRVFILADNKGQRIQGHRADWLQESRSHVKQALPVRGGKAGGNAWPSSPGELANDTGERLSLSNGQRNEPAGQRDAEFKCRSHIAWPSSPGEPQHEWEPPRVVSKTKPALGRDADGSASGLDYAELCISGDNRTDELRLLGNGVVPATATRAFLTLIKQLSNAIYTVN